MSFQKAKIIGRNVNSEEYHEHGIPRGDPSYPVSPSMLKLFGESPAEWIEGAEPNETKTKAWGNLIDCLVFTPDQFKSRYAVQPETYEDKDGDVKEWNNRAKACKQWNKDHDGMKIISFETHQKASAAVLRLRKDETIRRFIDESDKQVHVAGEWNDKETGLVVPVKCLIDLVPKADSEFGKCLGDLKTTRSIAYLKFLFDAFTFGYHTQGAFDLDLYRAAIPTEDRMEWCLVIQKNVAPWLPGRRAMTDDPSQPDNLLDMGRASYTRLLKNYCVCLKTGKWPDHEAMAENNPEMTNYVAQGWIYMRAMPFMLDRMPQAFELPEEDGDDEQTDSSDIPT